ncbi:MAG: hypothetical protein HKP05_00770 [Woeseiaceae bacterium]|nr:hypothetical protein [Gammaproteobacteria bacterium]NNK24156.1 hypothetical protein [Woeseiaceae bacterium]
MRQYSDNCRTSLILCCALLVLAACARDETDVPKVAQNACADCHETRSRGFNPAHAFAAENCVVCHGGDSQALDEPAAHAGLVAFPGNMDNAGRTCGTCHAERVASVSDGLMHTARGMVHTTRLVIDGDPGPAHTQNLQSLGDSIADSMLRKQCASCHLGHPKTVHAVDVTTSRGGGCLACHVAEHPDNAHPALTADVSDARCFGCHSRSGRISLSFAGLAESDEPGLRLADGRPVERLPADVHHVAGMRCTDCHDADDVMGAAGDAVHQRAAVSARCTDCHEPHDDDKQHERLTCAACHSQWAPQCFGCHMEYDADGEQWDHIAQEVTPGRWSDTRWNVRNVLPALGVNADGMIEPFVPGMIMTTAHPGWDEVRFVRLFAPLSPHTTGASRSCASCHRSSEALGLGPGELTWRQGALSFAPSANEAMPDGLPPEAWTNLGNTRGGRAPLAGQRPFDENEMKRIFGAEIGP